MDKDKKQQEEKDFAAKEEVLPSQDSEGKPEEESEDLTELEADDISRSDDTAVSEEAEDRPGTEAEDSEVFFGRKIKKLEEDKRKLESESKALMDRLSRLAAEYDNFRKRTAKEKEELADACTGKILKDILPVMDNLERALVTETDDLPGLKEGVQMTLDQFTAALKKMDVEEISTKGGFDPRYHEAVMHEVDESLGEKAVKEVFLKGYKKGDRVIRHSIVKVAN